MANHILYTCFCRCSPLARTGMCVQSCSSVCTYDREVTKGIKDEFVLWKAAREKPGVSVEVDVSLFTPVKHCFPSWLRPLNAKTHTSCVFLKNVEDIYLSLTTARCINMRLFLFITRRPVCTTSVMTTVGARPCSWIGRR